SSAGAGKLQPSVVTSRSNLPIARTAGGSAWSRISRTCAEDRGVRALFVLCTTRSSYRHRLLTTDVLRTPSYSHLPGFKECIPDACERFTYIHAGVDSCK